MWIQKEGDRILGMIIGEEGSKDGYDKSGSNYVMADTKAHEGHPSILGLANFYCHFIQDFSQNCYTTK